MADVPGGSGGAVPLAERVSRARRLFLILWVIAAGAVAQVETAPRAKPVRGVSPSSLTGIPDPSPRAFPARRWTEVRHGDATRFAPFPDGVQVGSAQYRETRYGGPPDE
jgi:hypothetical protein